MPSQSPPLVPSSGDLDGFEKPQFSPQRDLTHSLGDSGSSCLVCNLGILNPSGAQQEKMCVTDQRSWGQRSSPKTESRGWKDNTVGKASAWQTDTAYVPRHCIWPLKPLKERPLRSESGVSPKYLQAPEHRAQFLSVSLSIPKRHASKSRKIGR